MILYFTIVFLSTWMLWFTASAVTVSGPRMFLFYSGVFMPGIIALAMTWHSRGIDGVRALVVRLAKADVRARWFLFALFFIASIKVLVAVILRVTSGHWPLFGSTPIPLMFGAAIISTLLLGQAGEEIGWRGYALPSPGKLLRIGRCGPSARRNLGCLASATLLHPRR